MPTFAIYYRKDMEGFRTLRRAPKTTKEDLKDTELFGFIKLLEADTLEEIYWNMQGENWSPNGEARGLIERSGTGHTSMSVGDVAVDTETGDAWVVAPLGWEKIHAKDAYPTTAPGGGLVRSDEIQG